MGKFYKSVRDVSQDTIHLLEDLIDQGAQPKAVYQNIIADHQDILRGITDVSIISAAYSKSHQFLQRQEELFKRASKFTNAVLCKVMARRIREVVIESLSETQPIVIQDLNEEE